MRAMKYWMTAIVIDLAVFGAIGAYLFLESSQALNLAEFWLWSLNVIRILVGLTANKSNFEKNPRPAGFTQYHVVTEILLISTLVWIGCFWLASTTLLSAILLNGARNRATKTEVV